MIKETEIKKFRYNKIVEIIGDNNAEEYLSNIDSDFNKVMFCNSLKNTIKPTREDSLIQELRQGNKITLWGVV